MDSAILEKILERRLKREREWLKRKGLITHISTEKVHVRGLFGGDAYENGEIRVGALALLGKTLRHELAHEAHAERVFTPVNKLRKRNTRPLEFPSAFGAISEMLAAISEHEKMYGMKLERISKKTYDNYADSLERAAMLLSVRNTVLKMWEDLRTGGLNRENAHTAILHALYNSKTLEDLEVYRDAMKHYAELRSAGVDTNPSEVIAMRRLATWWNGGRSGEKK